jgi:hypothetical protein
MHLTSVITLAILGIAIAAPSPKAQPDAIRLKERLHDQVTDTQQRDKKHLRNRETQQKRWESQDSWPENDVDAQRNVRRSATNSGHSKAWIKRQDESEIVSKLDTLTVRVGLLEAKNAADQAEAIRQAKINARQAEINRLNAISGQLFKDIIFEEALVRDGVPGAQEKLEALEKQSNDVDAQIEKVRNEM